jgi:hypothetical protein
VVTEFVVGRGEIQLQTAAARHMVALLGLLAELPSTPAIAAAGACHYLALIDQQLSMPHHQQKWERDRPTVTTATLDIDSALAVIELLDLFVAMPSTPPVMACDAARQADFYRFYTCP